MKIQQDKDGQRNTAHRFYRLRRSSIMIEAFTRGNGAQIIDLWITPYPYYIKFPNDFKSSNFINVNHYLPNV
jgi:hypothetical protein